MMYYVFNETDGILACPDLMTGPEADAFMISFRERFHAQGYKSVRIPWKDLRLKRIPEDEL